MLKSIIKGSVLLILFIIQPHITAQEVNFSNISIRKLRFIGEYSIKDREKLKEILLVGISISVDNIVNAHTTRIANSSFPYRYKYLLVDRDLSFSIMEQEEFKIRYNPPHPDSIKDGHLKGYVLYPNIDIQQEYLDIEEMIILLKIL